MSDTIQNITIPQNQWVDLYALSSIAVGTQITVENTGDIDIYLSVQAAQPAIGTDNYNILARNNGVRLQNSKDDAGAWAYCNGSSGKINICVESTTGFFTQSATVTTVDKSTSDILSGRGFYGSDILRGIASDATVDFLVETGSVDALINFSVKSIGNYEIEMYEDSITSNDGTALQNFNFKRSDITTTIETIVYHQPTITDLGNMIVESLNYGGERNSVSASDSDSSFLLKPNTKYVIRFTNTSGNVVDMAYSWRIVE